MKRYYFILSVMLFSFHFFVHSAQASPPFSDCASQDKVPEEECQALVDFYNITNGSGWTDNTSWLVSYYVCTWYGVTCTGATPLDEGNVKGLSLSSNQLTGSIPSSIGNLTSLTSLHLPQNQLTGSIPPEIWNMTNLTVLNLGTNQLSGSIPSTIGNLTSLDEMYLDNNQLCGQIPSSLANTPLTALQIANNYLYTNDPSLIAFLDLNADTDWKSSQGDWQPVCGFPWTMFFPAITKNNQP